MSSYWIPVVAALGASALTGLVAFGLDDVRARRERRERLKERRQLAYAEMISHAAALALAAGSMSLTAKLRSGLVEGMDIVFRHRKPIDPLDLHDWLMKELGPMLDAMAEIWVVGTPKAVVAANELLQKCNRVLEQGTTRGESGSSLVRYLFGEKWTTTQAEAFQEAINEMADARKVLAEVARVEMNMEFAHLFASEVSK